MTDPGLDHGWSLHAWVDESMKFEADGSRGDYVLAATVADLETCDPIREALKGLRKGRQQRLHWHSEPDGRRSELVTAVARFDLAAIVVIGAPMLRSKQERARRACLERLLHELDKLGVEHVHTEARTDVLNTRDRHMVEVLRKRGAIGRKIRVDTARPMDEPMLWVPDVVAGAVAASRGSRDNWLGPLRQMLTQIEVAVR